MTDLMVTDNTAFETTGSDIRVFGKWTGTEIQISDMSLEDYPWSKTTQISSTLGWSFSSEAFPKGIHAHRRASRMFIDVSRT